MIYRERPEARRWHLAGYALGLVGACLLFSVDRVFGSIAGLLNVVFGMYFVRHLSFSVAAARWADPDMAAADVPGSSHPFNVAVLVACKNEEVVVNGLVASLLALHHGDGEMSICIIDDASTDTTPELLDAATRRHPRLHILHRPVGAGGGKSGALNDGYAHMIAKGLRPDIVVIFDADHEPSISVIERLTRHFRDPSVGAVMGRCVIRNAGESKLAGVVFVDFLSGYLVNEYGRQALFELPAYGGANCAVRASTLETLGGWNPHTVTEDTDLTLRIVLAGQRVRFDPTAVDYEEAVTLTKRYWTQRYRWARGHQKVLRDYMWPILRSRHLGVMERVEAVMFLGVYHIPVLCALGLSLTVARVCGWGGDATVGLLPLSMLLFIGPMIELTVGMILARTARGTAWRVIGFLPSFALSIVIVTKAWFDGMLGRKYSWAKTARSGVVAGGATGRDDAPMTESVAGSVTAE